MDDQGTFSRAARILVLLAMFFIVVAGLRLVAPLLTPFLLALFLALLCLPPVQWLQTKRVPGWLSVAIVFGVFFLVASGILSIVADSVTELRGNIGGYIETYDKKVGKLETQIEERFGIDIPERGGLNELLDANKLFGLATAAAGQFGSILGNLVVVMLMLAFLLAELQALPAKLTAMRAEGQEDTGEFNRIVRDVNRYVFLKSVVSLATGGCAAAACAIVGVDFPILWGLLAFLFNFIPNIGSFMAAVPPILIAFLQANLNLGDVGVLAGSYVGINFFFGNVVEPRMMGKSLDLSTLVVFLSMIFWGWVFGAVGMLLSVPITMVLKIACERSPTTRPIAILLGSTPEPKPDPEPETEQQPEPESETTP